MHNIKIKREKIHYYFVRTNQTTVKAALSLNVLALAVVSLAVFFLASLLLG